MVCSAIHGAALYGVSQLSRRSKDAAGPGVAETLGEVSCVDNRDGSYACSVTAAVAGEYYLAVSWVKAAAAAQFPIYPRPPVALQVLCKRQHVRGSPFPLKAAPPSWRPPVAQHTTVTVSPRYAMPLGGLLEVAVQVGVTVTPLLGHVANLM